MEDTKKPVMLIVEDDQENQTFLNFFMKRKFKTYVADDEFSFYEQLAKDKFDIILMDISLKGKKDGLQLTREIRADEKYNDVLVVGLSAHAFQRDKENAKKAGVDMFLTKPIPNDALMRHITQIMKERKGIEI
ncbi:MAG: response regulator [Ignavibacteria bacterium]|nr:MAG: response regulator [Ignavibacteria bacterium]